MKISITGMVHGSLLRVCRALKDLAPHTSTENYDLALLTTQNLAFIKIMV